MRTLPIYLFGILTSCTSDPETPGRDPTRVFETRTRAGKTADSNFDFERVTAFRTEEALPGLEVRAILIDESRVLVATKTHLLQLQRADDRFEPVAGIPGIVDLAVSTDGLIAATTSSSISILTELATTRTLTATAAGPFLSVTFSGDKVFAATSGAILGEVDGRLVQTYALESGTIRDLAVVDQTLYAATESGILKFDLPSWTPTQLRAPGELGDDDVRALTARDGTLAAATRTGYTILESEIVKPKRFGLPTDDLTSIDVRGGTVLVGHPFGASAMAERVDHYTSGRWIQGERATAVALEASGVRWIGSTLGLSRIDLVSKTFADKANTFESKLERHWRMDGFLDEEVLFDDAWDHSVGTPRTDDHDNDGLWTEMQIGAWCYAYATTKDEKFYEKARRAMDVMQLQFDIPALTFEAAGLKRGFITRSLVRDDEGEVFSSKATQSNWHLQTYEGRNYYWKDDTSSDEYAGHFFGIPVFFDLCAKSEAEKSALADRVRSAMDYIIAGSYELIDLDGQPTTHGHWENLAIAAETIDGCPDRYPVDDCLSSWGGGGWLNSLEILGHLLATWHLTGDEKYYDEYERLYTDEGYGKMIPVKESTVTVTDPRIANHSDHELALLAYTTLLRYEPNPDRREQVVTSVLTLLSYELEERNPWHLAVVASGTDEELPISPALGTLREMSLDMRQWPVDNSHRKDAGSEGSDRHGRPQFDRAFPYDELPTMKWNSSPYSTKSGGNPRSVQYPTPWLLAYWMLRYHGVIE